MGRGEAGRPKAKPMGAGDSRSAAQEGADLLSGTGGSASQKDSSYPEEKDSSAGRTCCPVSPGQHRSAPFLPEGDIFYAANTQSEYSQTGKISHKKSAQSIDSPWVVGYAYK